MYDKRDALIFAKSCNLYAESTFSLFEIDLVCMCILFCHCRNWNGLYLSEYIEIKIKYWFKFKTESTNETQPKETNINISMNLMSLVWWYEMFVCE